MSELREQVMAHAGDRMEMDNSVGPSATAATLGLVERPLVDVAQLDSASGVILARTEGVVTAAQCDLNDHLNMAEYLKIIDSLSGLTLDEIGVGEAYVASQRKSFFASRVAIRYLLEMTCGVSYVAEARLLAFDRRRLLTYFCLYNGENGQLVAKALLEWAHVDLSSRRALDLPASLANTFDRASHLFVERLPKITL
ncbi:acyl-CoA thioesterase FadM [Mycoplana sp. BE70]|uniref:acyl-CoA thioesterase n=1 Tax=Mycoplana sp. BE70 TaxID=2817775 RepID=UPI002854E45A|nr:thioesterase family protein [Mycoplana sp. BE70]MDR6759367.1 acyl-CoA thioesterase FadM [Mycoplana sp. BE70]